MSKSSLKFYRYLNPQTFATYHKSALADIIYNKIIKALDGTHLSARNWWLNIFPSSTRFRVRKNCLSSWPWSPKWGECSLLRLFLLLFYFPLPPHFLSILFVLYFLNFACLFFWGYVDVKFKFKFLMPSP